MIPPVAGTRWGHCRFQVGIISPGAAKRCGRFGQGPAEIHRLARAYAVARRRRQDCVHSGIGNRAPHVNLAAVVDDAAADHAFHAHAGALLHDQVSPIMPVMVTSAPAATVALPPIMPRKLRLPSSR
jgi:hypothetical protein